MLTAQPALKGDITVNTDIVTVGDMFDNPGELAETAIFRAPSPGTTGIVPSSIILVSCSEDRISVVRVGPRMKVGLTTTSSVAPPCSQGWAWCASVQCAGRSQPGNVQP